jgi:hypothetical protein
MNKQLRSKLQAALKNQPALQISEEHLKQTIQATRIAYQNRRQQERIRYPAFLLRQVRFIGAPVWLLQGFLLLCACWVFGSAVTGTVSDLAPRHLPVLLGCFAVFISMTSIPFIGRSAHYQMLEIEIATRVSLPKLLLARILIIGIGDTLLLTVSFLLAKIRADYSAEYIAIYLLLPYLIACCGCLFIQIYTRGQHQGFTCTTFCFSLVALLMILYKVAPVVYEQTAIGVWGMLCAMCVGVLVIGLRLLLDKAAFLDLSANGI